MSVSNYEADLLFYLSRVSGPVPPAELCFDPGSAYERATVTRRLRALAARGLVRLRHEGGPIDTVEITSDGLSSTGGDDAPEVTDQPFEGLDLDDHEWRRFSMLVEHHRLAS
jgi:hypothetical protein